MQRSPRGTEPGVDGGVGDQVEVRVGQHQHVLFAPPSALHPLAVARGGLVDVSRDRGRSHERDRRDVRMPEQGVHRLLVALDDVEHGRPAGRPSFSARAIHNAAEGSFSDGFNTTVLPHGERDREEPQRHHGRKVERADDPDDAESLPQRVQRPRPLRRSRCTPPWPGARSRRRTPRPRDPRATSPRASAVTLPCSLVRMAANSPLRR